MTTTTAGWVDKHKNRHLRTYIPDSVCETLKIQNGDKLTWLVEQRGNKLVAIMSKDLKPRRVPDKVVVPDK